ncbi:hypothetical protein V6N13_029879 [Hibiscus sabdariffa]|uniref:Uncharacterized protein n=1 Tax=Hibiscus sabdariffa TaxID=183260 RepID=A0ABR2A1B1_9ROSI
MFHSIQEKFKTNTKAVEANVRKLEVVEKQVIKIACPSHNKKIEDYNDNDFEDEDNSDDHDFEDEDNEIFTPSNQAEALTHLFIFRQ